MPNYTTVGGYPNPDPYAEDVEVYVCPRCGARSYHPKDAAERYCGRCHLFEGEEMLEEPR